MTHVDHKYERSYVMTYKEIIFTFFLFTIILIVLYPKNMLKEQILAEETNYDLSMLYLKNFLEQEPENEVLMISLAEQSLKSGKKDLSLRLLELLLRSDNPEHRNKATLLSYDLKKDDYINYIEEEDKPKLKKDLKDLFVTIIDQKMYNEDHLDKWYHEAIFIEDYKYINIFVQKKLVLDPENIALLKQAYYISIYLKNKNDSVIYLNQLAKLDKADKEKWEMDGYYLLLNLKRYEEAKVILENNSNESIEWRERYASYYILRKSYARASEQYMKISQQVSGPDKKKYFIKAVETLQAGNQVQRAANLAYKHQNKYLKEKEMRMYFLKLYIAAGDLDKAAKLANKILVKEMR